MKRNEKKTVKLDKNKLNWIGVRFLDPNSFTFFHDKSFYKAVRPHAVDYFLRIYQSDFFSKLVELDMFPKMEQVEDIEVEGFPLIFRQQTDEFSVPSSKWSPSMFRDAALLSLNIQKELVKNGYCLGDGHTGNIIMQDHAKLKWCDIGSILPFRPQNTLLGIKEIIKYIINPLLIRQKTMNGDLMRFFSTQGMSEKEAEKMGIPVLSVSFSDQENSLKAIHQLLDYVNNITISWKKTLWSNYHDGCNFHNEIKTEIENPKISSQREAIISRFLNLFNPKTVIDLGSNSGYFSRIAAMKKREWRTEVLSCDIDEWAVDKHYNRLKNDEEDDLNIKPCINGVESGTQADLVLALALTHHLFFTEHYNLKLIASELAKQTRQSLITEFMPNGMGGYHPVPDPLPSNYTLELFTTHLQHLFETVEVADYPVPPKYSKRILIICNNKKAIPDPYPNGPLPDGC